MNSSNRLVRLAVLQALACASGMLLTAPTNAGATGDDTGASASTPASSTTADSKKKGTILLAQASPAASADQSNKNTADDSALAEVIVVGVKQALATSQYIKKESSTFVDSITATDIGAFPDKSASDALQRIPGITVNRLQSNDDSTHPSGEPTNILIRGLTQVRTEFNGRDTFTADSARGLNFNDISPELLSRADAYKNQTAEMIEGGIAGTVDLRTRLPFDQEGHALVGSVQGDFGSLSNQLTPAYSVLASDSIRTDFGRFGLLLDYSRSHVITRTESVIDDKMDTYCSSGYGSVAHAIVNPDGSIPCTSNVFGGTGWAFAPDGIRYSQVDYDRDRIGSTIAGQYENNSKSLLATIQYTDSTYHNKWLEDASHAILDGTYYGTPAFNPRASSILAGSSGLVFGSNGMLQSGHLTQAHGSWAGSYSAEYSGCHQHGLRGPGRALRQRLRPRIHLHNRPGMACTSRTKPGISTTRRTRRNSPRTSSGTSCRACMPTSMPSTSIRTWATTISWWPRDRWPTISTARGATAFPKFNSYPDPTSTTPAGI